MSPRGISCAVCGSNDEHLMSVARGNRGLDYIAKEHPVVICRQCGLVYLDPQHAEEDYARYYASADYKPITASAKAMLRRYSYRRIQAAFLLDTLRQLDPKRNAAGLSVLDIGCGPGILLHYLAEAGLDVSGLEANPHAADYAEKTFGLRITRGSIFDEQLPQGAFDVVTSTASMEHFTDPLTAVLTMKRALKPGGLLYVNTPDLRGMVLKKGEGNWFKFVHTYYFTEVSLTNLLEKAGLRVIRSWAMPPQLEASVLSPGNYCSGELNIIVCNDPDAAAPSESRRRETVDDLIAAYAVAQRRDRVHALVRRAARWKPVAIAQYFLAKVFPPRPIFGSFYNFDGSVNVSIFPPLQSHFLSSPNRLGR